MVESGGQPRLVELALFYFSSTKERSWWIWICWYRVSKQAHLGMFILEAMFEYAFTVPLHGHSSLFLPPGVEDLCTTRSREVAPPPEQQY